MYVCVFTHTYVYIYIFIIINSIYIYYIQKTINMYIYIYLFCYSEHLPAKDINIIPWSETRKAQMAKQLCTSRAGRHSRGFGSFLD